MMFAKAVIGLLATGCSLLAATAPADAIRDGGQEQGDVKSESNVETPAMQDPVPSPPPSGDSESGPMQSSMIEKEAKAKETQTREANAKPAFRGRLPRYYAAVVTPTQRNEIYSIQRRYRTRLDALELQLAELKKQEKDEVSKVLDTNQREYVAEQLSKALAGRSPK